MKKIKKEMTIAETLSMYPETQEVMQKHLGFCASCPSASLETIALGAHLHEKDVDEIVKELNKAVKNNKEKK